MTMRCTASSMPARSSSITIRPMPDDAYAYQDGYDDGAEEPGQKRRGGMVTVIVVLALAVVGTGAAFAYRTYVGSPRSRRAADHQGRHQSDQDRAGAVRRLCQAAGSHGDGRRHREDRSARGSPGRRQRQGRSAHGVSAAEPERQSAVGGERRSEQSAAGQRRKWHDAEQRAAQDQDPDRAGRPARRTPRCRSATPPRQPSRRRLRGPPRHRRRPPAQPANSANASANAPLSLSPQGARRLRCGSHEPGSPPPTPVQTAPAPAPAGGGYLVQVSSQRNEADAQASFRAPAGQVPGGAGIACAGDQARRPRRQGRLLPRHGGPVRDRPKRRRSSAAA